MRGPDGRKLIHDSRVSVNLNFRSIHPDHIREIVIFALRISEKFSFYVDDEIVTEREEEDGESFAEPVVYIKSDLVEEIKKDHDDPKEVTPNRPTGKVLGYGAIRTTGEDDYVPMNESEH